jgi:diguanylate cyclase (GGDEF)-like protein/PAS domain S-box-containing protein
LSAVGPTGSDHLWKHLWDSTTDAVAVLDRQGRIRHINAALESLFGRTSAQAIGLDVALLQPERVRGDERQSMTRQVAAGAARRTFEARGLHRQGHEIPLEVTLCRLEAHADGQGEPLFAAFIRDITQRRLIEKRLEAQREVLEKIASGAPLDATLERIVELMEREFPSMLGSVLLRDASGQRVHVAAAPSLPAAWNRAVEGEVIGARAGSHGKAPWGSELVVTTDIATDPLWERYRDAALAHGLRACWSMPVLSAAGAVLGTFAMYYREPRSPSKDELELIGVAASFAGIAIERSREHASMSAAVERFELISKATNDAVWDWNLASDELWWNDAFYASFGYAREEIPRTSEAWTDSIHPEDKARVVASIHEVIDGGGTAWQSEYRFRRRDGSYAAIFDRGFVVRDAFGEAVRMIGAMMDISERKRSEEQLAYLAQFDTLTGLPNRNLFRDRLAQAVSRAHREGWITGVAFIDLDRFKEINDTLGHAAGDEVLKAAAGRLRACLREGDTLARLGGDEFTAILEGLKSADAVARVAQKMMGALAAPMSAQGREVFVNASIGFALYPDDGTDADTLLKHADTAMYEAKNAGRNGFKRYASTMTSEASERVTLEASLRRALERRELELHYQPVVRLSDRQVLGAEALLRWRHPERGLVSPAEFIPLAEATGLIVPIGEWVLGEACREAARWRSVPPVNVGVNLSARQFRNDALAETVRGALAASGLAGGRLVLEITETLLMENPEASRRLLEPLKASGVRVVLDDFGTGYSSLAYLRHFPLDAVKIDRSFIRDIADDPEDATIVKAVIALAHELRLGVTAEGVETQEQLDFLLAHGCDNAQGFFFARPEPAAELVRRLGALAPSAPAGP